MAGLTTTQTFSDGDTVTAAKLNNIISNCTIDDDAVVTAKINDDAVTLANMADDSVDTGQLVDDAVQNSKLNDMAARTVKVNATDAAANPTDMEIAANKLLVGTSDSLKGVTFTSDLELDAADDAATLIRAADTLISGKSTVTVVPANDEILVHDADGSGNKLGKATVTDMIQSLPALTTTSGVVRLATQERAIDPSTAGTVDADVITVNQSGSMLAKAWAKLSYDKDYNEDDGTLTVDASFNLDSPTYSFTGNRGLVAFPITTDLDSSVTDYCVMANAFYRYDGATYASALSQVTIDSSSSFSIQFRSRLGVAVNPFSINLVIFA